MLDEKAIDNYIKTERAKYSKAWREKNKEHIKQYIKEWRAKNKEKVKEYNKRYWRKRIIRQYESQNQYKNI